LKQQNQYGETDELEMFHQFQLEIKRPDILSPAAIGIQPRPIVKPFTVKGITPYYDNASKSYKYLVYGHYLDFSQPVANRRQVGCVKYYDPGNKIGPQPKASQLYDILRFIVPVGAAAATVNSVVEMYSDENNNTNTFVYPVFAITGVFSTVDHLDEYGNNVIPQYPANNIVAWTTGKNGLGLPYDHSDQVNHQLYSSVPGSQTVIEINRILGPPPANTPSNTFTNFWHITNRVPAVPLPISSNLVSTINLNLRMNLAQMVVMNAHANSIMLFSLNLFYTNDNQICIITKTIANDNTRIFIPYIHPPFPSAANEILIPAANALKISCGAVSINKDVYNIVKEINFYRREYCSTFPVNPVNVARVTNIQNKINSLEIRILIIF
jgi:hypothetical protein